MSNTNFVQHSAEGVGTMKAGGTITFFSVMGTWLTDNADLIGVICMLIGTGIAIAGYVRNSRVVNAREKREKIEHELLIQRKSRDK